MAVSGVVFMAAAPERPVQSVGDRVGGCVYQCGEQVSGYVAGQGDQVCRRGVCGMCAREDGEEGVCEHRQQGPAMPGPPVSDLMLVQAGQGFAGLEVLLG